MPGGLSETRTTPGAGCAPETETLELWLCGAPSQALQELEAIRPGVYAVHNDAPHTLTELLELMHSIDLSALRSQGIEMNQIGPRNEGHLGVGVSSDVAAAQAWFEAEYGDGLFRVFAAEPIRRLGRRRWAGVRS
jgi:hypothetical protein